MSNFKILGLADKQTPEQYKVVGDAEYNEDLANEDAQYIDSLENSQGFFSKLPRNIAIGLTHAGRNLHNMPHDLAKLAEWPAEKLTGGLKHPLSSYLPYDNADYSDIFGGDKNSNTLADRLIQGGIEHAPEISGGIGIIKGALRKFPITQGGAARQLADAEKLAKKRGVSLPIEQEMISSSLPFLPRTHASKELIEGAKSGDYSHSFGLQSQIGKHERDLRKSTLAAERLLAPEARELKQNIIKSMESKLRAGGHDDIADMLKGGIDDYRKYIKFRDEVKPYLTKLGIPGSMLALVGFGTQKGRKAASMLID